MSEPAGSSSRTEHVVPVSLSEPVPFQEDVQTHRYRPQTSSLLLALAAASVSLLFAILIVSTLTLSAVGGRAVNSAPSVADAPATAASVAPARDIAALKREVERLGSRTETLESSTGSRPKSEDAQSLSRIERAVAQNSSDIARLSTKVASLGVAPAAAKAPAPTQAAVSAPTPAGAKALVRVFFGTNRAIQRSGATLDERFTASRGVLTFGTVDVSIPQGHTLGKLEQKLWPWHSANDPTRFFVVQNAVSLSKEQFLSRTKDGFARLGTRSALVFIHGFNVSFEDAALRSAQMAYDLDMKSLPAFFSWPSKTSIPKYTIDEQMAEWAEPDLRKFLETFADDSAAENIIILAHSMGSRTTTRALKTLLAARPELQSRFREVILAAPDIDADVFKNDLMPALIAMQQRVTLYASAGDKALRASKEVHGAPRAGDAGEELVVLNGVETLDASSIDTDFLGHSYYGSTRALLTDINLLLYQSLRASKRPFLESRSVADVPYWVFKP